MTLSQKTGNLLYFTYASFLFLFLAINIGWLINLTVENKTTVSHENGTLYIKDFIQYYRDGKIATSADHDKIYNRDVRLKWLNQLISPDHIENPLLTQGPPLQIFLLLPFLKLPLSQAHLAWAIFSFLFGIAGIAILLDKNWQKHPKISLLILLSTAASIPGFNTLFLGQTSWYTLGIAALYWWSWLKEKYPLAGLFLALSIVKFQYIPFWLIAALAKRQYKTIFFMLLGITLIFFATGLVFGWQNVFDYPKTFWHIEKDTNVNANQMISLRTLLTLFFPQSIALPLSIILMLACLIFLFRLWSSVKENQINLAIAITVIAALLTSAHSFSIDTILLSIPAILTLPEPISKLFTTTDNTISKHLYTKIYYSILLLFPILTILFLITFSWYDYLTYFAMNLALFITAIFMYRNGLEVK